MSQCGMLRTKADQLTDFQRGWQVDLTAGKITFAKKTEEKILQGIAFLSQHADRHLFPEVEEQAQQIQAALAELPGVVRLQVAGSLRRKRETIKDIDMVISVADDAGEEVRAQIMEVFTTQSNVRTVQPNASAVIIRPLHGR